MAEGAIRLRDHVGGPWPKPVGHLGCLESEGNGPLRRIAGGAVDYAICMLGPDGRVTTWNRGAERTTGYKARVILGKHFSEFYQPEDRESGLPAKALQIARKEKHFLTEGWRLRKDGSSFYASIVIDPVYEKRKLVGYAMVIRDMTERRQARAKPEHAAATDMRIAIR